MQFSTIISLLAVAGMTVAAPAVDRRQTNDLVGVNVDHTKIPVNVDVPVKNNDIANNLLEDGVNVDHTLSGPLNVGALGNAGQYAPKGDVQPF
ncbi:protein ScwA [Aspergillus thermomutatus]|uniref:Uncharacterized protein n=1 Tax=Aspergillus thermomutatus TaxID=41047 RepID=A0A397GC51_ASPTH|nr:uncharacterized protein CDV56_104977 [Aspergillus thermomutatus]RHZ48585.1 hypothetical protein CDV56_104977 [Aspergillus thermomutatus]